MVKLKRVNEDLSNQSSTEDQSDSVVNSTIDTGNSSSKVDDWMKCVPPGVKPVSRSDFSPLIKSKTPDMEFSEFLAKWNKYFPGFDWRIDDYDGD